MAFSLPRPGPALKALLITVGVAGLLSASALAWIPWGAHVAKLLVCNRAGVMDGQLWRLVTSALIQQPGEGAIGHLFFMLLGLYFLSPSLERRWGGARFVRFFLISILVGNVLAVVVDFVAPASVSLFHPSVMYGPGAAVAAIAVAWAGENAEAHVRLFFIIPVKGKHFLWLTIAYCFLGVLLKDSVPEGVAAPFGGVLTGLLLGGSPSPLRTLYLLIKLRFIRGRAGGGGVALIRPQPRRSRPGSPPLRVVPGGLEDLSKRQPPKDKRYLN